MQGVHDVHQLHPLCLADMPVRLTRNNQMRPKAFSFVIPLYGKQVLGFVQPLLKNIQKELLADPKHEILLFDTKIV